MIDNLEKQYKEIIELDTEAQQIFRNSWPEAWLQINLPLGSTRALLAIEERNAYTPGRVADALGVSRTTVTGLLDRLEAEGLLTRSVDPSDRRCFRLDLTAKGHDLVQQIDGYRRDRLQSALAVMDKGDIEALHKGMAALIVALRVRIA